MICEITFDELYEKYYLALVGYSMHRFSQNRFDAEDNVSEVFTDLLGRWDSFSSHSEAGIVKWLYDKTKYVFYDECRAKKKRPVTVSYEEYMENTEFEERPECGDGYGDYINEIRKMLDGDEYGIFVKIVLEGKNIKTVSEILGMKPNTVKVKWYRIRKKLKPMLIT